MKWILAYHYSHPPDTYTNMTYFPSNCFELIRSFAGPHAFHPAKFHCKKVADAIIHAEVIHDGGVTYSLIRFNPHRTFKIKPSLCLLPTRLSPARVPSYIDIFRFDYSSLPKSFDGGKLPENFPSKGRHWRGKPMPHDDPDRITPYCVHSTKRIPNAYIKPHILLLHSKLLTAVAMKKYCKENKMKGYSKMKKADLITFILKYKFE